MKNIHHRFFPLDVDFLINSFLKMWKPNYIFLVDSEIWPNLILKAKKFSIPFAIINARITKKLLKDGLNLKKLQKIFSKFKLCLASNKETKNF